MKVTAVRTFVCDVFRTNWVFVEVLTDDSLHGVGESMEAVVLDGDLSTRYGGGPPPPSPFAPHDPDKATGPEAGTPADAGWSRLFRTR